MHFGREILQRFAAFGDHAALVGDREQLTYAQALSHARHIAGNFHAAGVRIGDRVGLAMQGNIDVVLGILACWMLSATPVVVDFRAPRSQRARLCRDFELKVLFESRHPPGEDVYPALLFEQGWKNRSPVMTIDAAADESIPAFLIFSSGTTGDPKAYVQSHEALTGRVMVRSKKIEGTAKRFLTPMALSYSATRHHIFAYLFAGGTVRFFPPLFSPSEVLEALLSFEASASALPPPVIARMVREVGQPSVAVLPALRSLNSVGGPALPEDKIAAYHYLSPGYEIAYASSLTGHISLLSGPDVLARPESAGRLARGVRVEILGPEGRPLPLGERGLIKAWTPTIASGVFLPGNKPFIDSTVMGADWGIPGDIGFLDEDGFLTIVDRESDMIVRGGVNVAPQELEKLIRTHPKVRDVAVAGFPDDTMGQEIAAFIVSDTGTVDEFQAFLRTHVAPDRRPREIRLVASLPYSDSGKLLRRLLVEKLVSSRQ